MSKPLRTGCAVALALVVLLVIWLGTGPEGGVRLANELEEYAIQHMEENSLLQAGEEVLAYYDVTISLDGSEAAILTDRRVLYFNRGRTTSIDLAEIANIGHRYENLIGDVIEIEGTAGVFLKIEIAPFNQGETFLNVLRSQWERAKGR